MELSERMRHMNYWGKKGGTLRDFADEVEAKEQRIAQLEVVKRAAEEFVNQSENVYWRGIEPQLGDAKTSIDMAYKNLKEALRGE